MGREHFNGEESLVKALTRRLGALKKVGRVASFKNRKMIAEGLIMSKLSNLIPLWAGCDSYLILALQRIQNKAARVVTRSSLSTAGHLAQCGWLSVQQLAFYQMCVLVYKVLEHKFPPVPVQHVHNGLQHVHKTGSEDGDQTDRQ